MCARATATARGPRTRRPSVAGGEHATPTSLTQTEERPPSRHRVRPRRCRIVVPGALNKINHRNNQWREAERGPGRGGRRVKAPTLPLRRRVRAPAREAARKSKAVAGGQGRTVVDRSADPVREKCPHTLRRSDRRDSREHQGVGLDDAGAGGRGRWPDCGPRQDTRRPAARHRRNPRDGRCGLERGAEAGVRPSSWPTSRRRSAAPMCSPTTSWRSTPARISRCSRSKLARPPERVFMVESECGAVAVGRTYLLPPL
jgi:hypothetical protein